MTYTISSDEDLVLVKIVPHHNHIIFRRVRGDQGNIVMEVGDVIKMEKRNEY